MLKLLNFGSKIVLKTLTPKLKDFDLQADDIVPLIGFPQFLFNDTLLDEYYLNVDKDRRFPSQIVK